MKVYDTDMLSKAEKIFNNIQVYYDIVQMFFNPHIYVLSDVDSSEYVVKIEYDGKIMLRHKSITLTTAHSGYSYFSYDPLMMVFNKTSKIIELVNSNENRKAKRYYPSLRRMIAKMCRKEKEKMLKIMREIGLLIMEVTYTKVEHVLKPEDKPNMETFRVTIEKYIGPIELDLSYHRLYYTDREVEYLLNKLVELSEVIKTVAKRAYVIFKMFNLI